MPADAALPQPDPDSWRAASARLALRFLPSLGVKPSWWIGRSAAVVPETDPDARPLCIEVVSHCWNYAPMLTYQLSALVLAPPQEVDVVMTVCHCPEDRETVALLEFFGRQVVPRVRWNWVELPRSGVLRRGYGRNLAARASTADWVWFTDCDVVWAKGAFDGLATALTGCRAALVYPREEHCTKMLPPNDQLLDRGKQGGRVLAVNFDQFTVHRPNRATGPLQIARGSVVRRMGYCDALPCFRTAADRWRKTYEDSAFRWLLGTRGTPLDVPGVYRIRHVEKGRYSDSWRGRARSWVRRVRDRIEKK